MTTKTKTKTTTLRDILEGSKTVGGTMLCNLIVADGGGYDLRCWAGSLSTNDDDWKFKVTKTKLQLIEGHTDRLQYSFDLDQEIRFKGDSVSLDPVDGEQACSELVTLRFFNVNNLYK